MEADEISLRRSGLRQGRAKIPRHENALRQRCAVSQLGNRRLLRDEIFLPGSAAMYESRLWGPTALWAMHFLMPW
jgi:hypothetical protein